MDVKKAGRPKGPEKAVLRFRVPVGRVEECRNAVAWVLLSDVPVEERCSTAICGKEDSLPPVGIEVYKGVSGVVVESQKAVEAKETGKVSHWTDVDVRALLEDVQSLSIKLEGMEKDLEHARSMDLDAKASYWRGMFLTLKAEVAKNQDL